MKDFEDIYHEYNRDIYHFLLKLTCCQPELAEELLQETFYQAFISFHRFQGRCSMKTWLCQIAKNTFYNYVRHEKRQSRVVQECVPDSGGRSAEQEYERRERLHHLSEAMTALEEREQMIIEYHLFAGLPHNEIAILMGMKETTVKVAYSRARVKLKKRLSEVYGYEI